MTGLIYVTDLSKYTGDDVDCPASLVIASEPDPGSAGSGNANPGNGLPGATGDMVRLRLNSLLLITNSTLL